MKEEHVDKAEKTITNLFLLINVATRRAEQIMEGSSPALNLKNAGPIECAIREISQNRIQTDEDRKAWTVVSVEEEE